MRLNDNIFFVSLQQLQLYLWLQHADKRPRKRSLQATPGSSTNDLRFVSLSRKWQLTVSSFLIW